MLATISHMISTCTHNVSVANTMIMKLGAVAMCSMAIASYMGSPHNCGYICGDLVSSYTNGYIAI